MHVCDSSAIIHAWDNYPIEKFPMLWDWLKDGAESGKLLFPWVVRDEVSKSSPDCYEFLLKPSDVARHKISPSNAIFEKPVEIKSSLGIDSDNYHSKGVGENDILIVSAACVAGYPLINNEGVQTPLPKQMPKDKLPAVCGLPSVKVGQLSVLDYIKLFSPVCGTINLIAP